MANCGNMQCKKVGCSNAHQLTVLGCRAESCRTQIEKAWLSVMQMKLGRWACYKREASRANGLRGLCSTSRKWTLAVCACWTRTRSLSSMQIRVRCASTSSHDALVSAGSLFHSSNPLRLTGHKNPTRPFQLSLLHVLHSGAQITTLYTSYTQTTLHFLLLLSAAGTSLLTGQHHFIAYSSIITIHRTSDFMYISLADLNE